MFFFSIFSQNLYCAFCCNMDFFVLHFVVFNIIDLHLTTKVCTLMIAYTCTSGYTHTHAHKEIHTDTHTYTHTWCTHAWPSIALVSLIIAMLVTIMPVYVACNCLVTSVGVVSLVQLGVYMYECEQGKVGQVWAEWDETGVSRMEASLTVKVKVWYNIEWKSLICIRIWITDKTRKVYKKKLLFSIRDSRRVINLSFVFTVR